MNTNTTATTEATPNARIIEKLRKIMALRDRAGTEGEAAAAAAMAQELMAAYNLTMTEIDGATTKAEAEAAGNRQKDLFTRSAMFGWQRKLWKAVAEANYCWYEAKKIEDYKNGRWHFKTYHHLFVGREVNVVATKVMGEYLEQAINQLCPFKPGGSSSKAQSSWKEGCADRLAERLADKKREMERESEAKVQAAAAANTSTAISLRTVAQSEDDANYAFVYGQEALEQKQSWLHDDSTCECRYCVKRREYRATWDKQDAVAVVEAKPETEAQRRKREAKEARENERWWKRHEARQEREARRLDRDAYESGRETGDEIGLDKQLGTSTQRQIG